MVIKLKESDNNSYNFNALNSLEQDYIVNDWSEIGGLNDTIWDEFNESIWADWNIEKQYIADECCNIPKKGNQSERWKGDTELGINVDKCYWNESSQGPYPEWKLDKVFDTFYGKTSSSVNEEVEFEIHFANMAAIDVKRAVDIDIWCKDDNGEYAWEYGVDAYNIDVYLNDDNDPYNARGYIKAVINQAQKFIDKFWNEINYRCSATPDEDWVRDYLENADYLYFKVDNKGNVYFDGKD